MDIVSLRVVVCGNVLSVLTAVTEELKLLVIVLKCDATVSI